MTNQTKDLEVRVLNASLRFANTYKNFTADDEEKKLIDERFSRYIQSTRLTATNRYKWIYDTLKIYGD